MANPFDIGVVAPTTDAAALAEIEKSNAARGVASPSAGDKASIEKYGTPLPPNDPASINGGRQNAGDLYIGPTNYKTLQGQYTPYQLEQATQRDANGNISWKQGVDISKIPRSAVVTPPVAPPVATPTASDIVKGSGVPVSNLSSTTNPAEINATIAAGAKNYLTGIDSYLNDISAKQQALAEAQKTQAETGRNAAIDKIKGIFNSTSNQDALAATREKFQIDQNIDTLNDIRQKIASASTALDSGILYEEGRPIRMVFKQGNADNLRKQGIATIGALQSAAEVVKGNIDIARNYADDTIAALKQDNSDQMAAADTLLQLYNDDLVRYDGEMKDQIEYRKKLLEDENKRLDDDKDTLLGFAEKYPQSFVKAGVTFQDSPDTAMQKMMPYLQEREKLEMESMRADLADKQAATKKKLSGGSGGSSSTGNGSTGAITGDVGIDSLLRQAFVEKIPLNQVLSDLAQDGVTLSTKQVNAAQDYWSTIPKDEKVEKYSREDLNFVIENLNQGIVESGGALLNPLDYLYLLDLPKARADENIQYLRALTQNKTAPAYKDTANMSTGGTKAPSNMSTNKK